MKLIQCMIRIESLMKFTFKTNDNVNVGGISLQVIISHINTDFDALASMLAAKKLYPEAQVVISDKQNIPVKQFLTIYRDTLDLVQDNLIDWEEVTELILVDEASLSRMGDYAKKLQLDNVKVTIIDHHPPKEGDVKGDNEIIEQVGAAVTLLIEEIRKRSLAMTSFEATLFGLGIYTDTGSFTYTNTTARDFRAASFLMDQGMNLEIVQRFSDEILSPEQQNILNRLFQQSTTHYINGLEIVVSSCQHRTFQKGLATLTQKLLEVTDADAVLTVVGMNNRVYIVGRASSERITLLPILKKWHGGGHEQAGSAAIKDVERETVVHEVIHSLDLMLKPGVTARDMMTSPVKTIPPETSIERSSELMYRYGHSGFPVVEGDQLLGIITRRDLEKANHHGLGHAPVKAYMSTNIVSIQPETTEEEIQKMIIERNIGRLPVVEDGKLIGIVSRTNIIESLHHQKIKGEAKQTVTHLPDNLKDKMNQQLPKEIYCLLQDISKTANTSHLSVYLIGGIVRDIFLGEPNDDIDIVVEGDGIAFSKKLQSDYGGDIIVHEDFGTATWNHPAGFEIDVTSSRLEFYDRPAALPDVETSTLKEDLYRRDFTINAMAIYLNQDAFGELVDPFQGLTDLREKRVKVLHNLSFVEDPTRILRGVRFETRFRFLMDEQTEKLALQSIERVKELSATRIVGEMKRLFKEDNPSNVIRRLFELEFWQQFGVNKKRLGDSLAHVNQLYKLYTKNKKLKESSNKPHWFTCFFIPFYYEGDVETAKRFALTKQDAKLLQEIVSLRKVPKWQQVEKIGDFHRVLKDYSDEAILFFVSIESFATQNRVIQYLERRLVIPTHVTGEDLIKQGLKPSAFFAKLLLELDVAILNKEVHSGNDALEWVQQFINEYR